MTELYHYGPLIFYSDPEDDQEGNYYWPGEPIVGYDDMGIPVDEYGDQCLNLSCILHPHHKPTGLIFNEFLNMKIPSVLNSKEWFDNAMLDVSEDKVKKYILRFLFIQRDHGVYRKGYENNTYDDLYTMLKHKLMTECKGDMKILIKRVWPL